MPWRSAGTALRRSGRSTTCLSAALTKRLSPPVARPQVLRYLHEHSSPVPPQRTAHAQLQQAAPDTNTLLRIQGLVRSIRKQKRIAFASISDGSTHAPVHAVLIPPELAKDITNGSYVDLTGRWVESPGRGQSHDLQVDTVNHVGSGDAEENPIQKKVTSAEFLRGLPHLRMRTGLGSLVARARGRLTRGVADFFEGGEGRESAVQVHPPVISSSDCEGAGEVFSVAPATKAPVSADEVHFFGEPKYLTVSNQLHLEAWSAELGNVWSLAPTFRAEASETPRHLAEFYMLEAEFRGMTELDEVIDQAEALIRYVARDFAESRVGKELVDYYADRAKASTNADEEQSIKDLKTRWAAITDPQPWRRLTYSTAMDLVQAAYSTEPSQFEVAPSWTDGLALEHEKWLVANVAKDRPMVVTDYPAAQKPFYMLPNDSAPQSAEVQTAACFDILLPHGYAEVCGGSLREHRLENLISAMREKGLLKQKSPAEQLPSLQTPDSARLSTPEPPSNGPPSTSSTPTTKTTYPHLRSNENLGTLEWYADLRRFGSSPHGGYGIGFDRLLAYLVGVSNVRDVVGFPRGFRRCDC